MPTSHPGYDKFARLTRQEEKAGLLDRSDIGHLVQWNGVLAEAGYALRGHQHPLSIGDESRRFSVCRPTSVVEPAAEAVPAQPQEVVGSLLNVRLGPVTV